MGHAAFFDYPNVPSVDPGKWEEWFHSKYDCKKCNVSIPQLLHRAANNSRSLDIGRPKFAQVRRNPNCGRTRCPDNFIIVNHFTATINKIINLSDHNFVLSNQDGVLVGHMS